MNFVRGCFGDRTGRPKRSAAKRPITDSSVYAKRRLGLQVLGGACYAMQSAVKIHPVRDFLDVPRPNREIAEMLARLPLRRK